MNTFKKIFAALLIVAVATPLQLATDITVQKVEAAGVVRVQLPCTKSTKPINEINADRSHHSENNGYALDIQKGDECASYTVRASIPGKVTFVGLDKEFTCDALGGKRVRNSLVRIDNGNGLKVDYYHNDIKASNTIKVGSVVTPGQIIGTMGEIGCAKGTHIHYEVWRNGVKLSYDASPKSTNPINKDLPNQWIFVEQLEQPNPNNLKKVSSVEFKGALVQSVQDKNNIVHTRFRVNNNEGEHGLNWSDWEEAGDTSKNVTLVAWNNYLYHFKLGKDSKQIFYRYASTVDPINRKISWSQWINLFSTLQFDSDLSAIVFNNRLFLSANRYGDYRVSTLELGQFENGTVKLRVNIANGTSYRNASLVQIHNRLYQLIVTKNSKVVYRYATTKKDPATNNHVWATWTGGQFAESAAQSDINAISYKYDSNYRVVISYTRKDTKVRTIVADFETNNIQFSSATIIDDQVYGKTLGETTTIKSANDLYQINQGLTNQVYDRLWLYSYWSEWENHDNTVFEAKTLGNVDAANFGDKTYFTMIGKDETTVYVRTITGGWENTGTL